MPIYEYRCKKGHNFEVMQRMADDPVTKCEVCGAPVQRVFHPVAIHFKGKGFYNTDYGTKRKARELEKSASEGADKHDDKMASQKKDADKTAKDAKPAKAEAKPKPKKD
jgi:putative FmdB family regulatory protein